MGDPKRTDMLVAGEELAPFTFQVTEEFNENFLHSMEDFHPRYMEGARRGGPHHSRRPALQFQQPDA